MKKKFSIVYHYFAHYRQPVLKKLRDQLSTEWNIELISDGHSKLPALKTIDMRTLCSSSCKWHKVKNVWLGPWLWQSGLVRNITKNRSEVIIFLGQLNFLSTYVASLIARSQGKKVYFWSHGMYGNEGLIKRVIRVAFYKLADGMLLYGKYSKELLIKEGFPKHTLTPIYNSLDYEEQRALERTLDKSTVYKTRADLFGQEHKSTPYVIFVGRLTKTKRLDLLLKAVKIIGESGNGPINVLLVGDGPEKKALQNLASSQDQFKVVFFGECHDEQDLSKLIYSANTCVAPGNVGLTAMHSLAYGTPVITHDDKTWQMPEFEAILPGRSGDFYTKNNAVDLSQNISKWVKTKEAHWAEVNKNCIDSIRNKYTPSYQVKVIEELLNHRPQPTI